MTTLRDAIGIVHETKNQWERRVPLVPPQIRVLVAEGIEVRVERSPTRAFRDEEFEQAGATLVDDATDCRMLMGVKEVKKSQVRAGQTVLCFSHTIKGQAHNMPLLAHFMALGATLVDYEVIVDAHGVRQVAFGRYAGLAGAHETLWTLGHRLAALGTPNPLAALRHAVNYSDLAEMVTATRAALSQLRKHPCPELSPCTLMVTADGRVSRGALEYLDLLGVERISVARAAELQNARVADGVMRVFQVNNDGLFARADGRFEFGHYTAHPERYVCTGAMYMPLARALVNGLYWDERFPRLLDDSTARRMLANGTLPLAIGDVSCDLRGGVEWTVAATQNDAPALVYDPQTGVGTVGVTGPGAAIMAVDNLPTALPRDASVDFSKALIPFVRDYFGARLTEGTEGLPEPLRRSVVVAGGKLTAPHAGLEKFLTGGTDLPVR